MVVHNPKGDFSLDESGRVGLPSDATQQAPGCVTNENLTFSGISVLSRALFAGCGPGPRPLLPLLLAAIEAGKVGGVHHRGLWVDVGTPERLAEVEAICRSEGEPT